MRAPDTSGRALPLKSKSARLRLLGGPGSGTPRERTASTGRRRLLGATSISRSISRCGARLCTAAAMVSKSSSTSP
eukprot:scaffold23_cov113-Isochrysis_galbana.AAC.4